MQLDLRRTRPRDERVLWWILAALIGLVAAGTVLVAIAPDWLDALDLDLVIAASDASRTGTLGTDFFAAVSALGAPGPLRIVLLLAAAAAFVTRHIRIGAWLVVTVVLEAVVAPLSKHLLRKPRPELDEPLAQVGGFAFPSGHAAAAGMAATALILLTLVVMRRGTWLRRGILAAWAVLGLLIAVSRVCLGVHYPSDVVVGLALGALCAYGPWLAFTHRPDGPRPAGGTAHGDRARVGVVYNPVKVGDRAAFQARVAAVAEREGFAPPLWFATSVEDPGPGQAHAALQAGVDLIVAAGGDGTVRMVCEEVARTGVPVGVLPLGTGNLLARNLGLPLNLTEALEVAFRGDERAVDLVGFTSDATGEDEQDAEDPEVAGARVETTSFLVMAGLGMDAAIMTGVRDDLKAKVGYLAYFVSGIKALTFPATKVEITVDAEEPRSYRARTVVVGNVGFLQGGIPLIPEAQIDDGRLDVVVIAPKRFWGWLAILWRVLTRRKRTNERLERLTGRRVEITAERPTPMQLDGDPIGEGTRIAAEVRSGVLLIRTPKPGTLINRPEE